jgi:heme/copper-type cytochrome/quinol oxidase subunit 3
MSEVPPPSGNKRSARPLAGGEVIYNVNPWGFLLGVSAALFGVLFAVYALLRVRHALLPTAAPKATPTKAVPAEIPIEME